MSLEMLNKVLEELMNMVISDNEICKLIGNDKENYLDDEVNSIELLYNRIIPYDINFDEPNTEKTYLIIDWLGGNCKGKIINGHIEFKVMCHKNLWKTNNGLRPYLIMDKIDKLIQMQNKQKQRISLGDISNPEFIGARPIGNLNGYSLIYEVSELRV